MGSAADQFRWCLQAEVKLAAFATKLNEFEEEEFECLADVEEVLDEAKATS